MLHAIVPDSTFTLNTQRGYFAFPPGAWSSLQGIPKSPPTNAEDANTRDIERDRVQEQEHAAFEEQKRANEEVRQKRLERERLLGEEGEFEWVRSGGILRDKQGRRDYTRTSHIRAEIQLQKKEAELLRRWASYEERWRALLSSNTPVTFSDIPWPLGDPPSSVSELLPKPMGTFFLESLSVRGSKVTKKERIRAGLLRWHPDKLGVLLPRVIAEDMDKVKDGIHAVLMCLGDLQHAANDIKS